MHVQGATHLPDPRRRYWIASANVGRLDGVGGGEVGDGAGDFEDAVEGAGGKVELGHCHLDEGAGLGRELLLAALADLAGAECGVGGSRGVGRARLAVVARDLVVPGARDAVADGARGLGVGERGELVVVDARDFGKQVDAVQERAGDAALVAQHGALGAGAGGDGVAVVAAGAGVHGGNEHEVGGVGDGAVDAGDGDDAVLERAGGGIRARRR